MPNLPTLPSRDAASHKGDFGRALLVGGSRGMAGSIALSGMAALRSGAGLVTVAVPDCCVETVASFDPCLMTVALPEHQDHPGQMCAPARAEIETFAAKSNCVAFGPGVGRSDGLDLLAAWLFEHLPQPMVIDADGINGLAARETPLADAGGVRIITPHPGEFKRLTGEENLSREEQEAKAEELAGEFGVIVVLKGHRTLVTDGTRTEHNETGNPGMATGGTGDVLTGVITALVCQGMPAWEAARLGAHIHGVAGDLAAEEHGQVGMVASDLIMKLPEAIKRL